MATFDGWDAPLYGYSLPNGQDTLAHFRTKGSKNGVRRYQNEDGTWTPLGLRERKAREGWGDGDRKTRRAEKRLAKAERRQARRDARDQRIAAYKEKKRQNSLKGLSDEELRQRISRLKMEQEYKELSKSPVLKTGEKLVSSILEYRSKKEQRDIERTKQAIELERIKTERTKALSEAKVARSEAEKSRNELKKAKTKSAIDQAAANLVNQKTQSKRFVADNTIRGGLKKRVNAWLSSGYAERKAESRYISGTISGSRRTKNANKRRDSDSHIDYETPNREQFFKNKKQGNGNDNDKKKKRG